MRIHASLLLVLVGVIGLLPASCRSASEGRRPQPTAVQNRGPEAQSPLHFAADGPWHTGEAELPDAIPVAWIANVPFSRKDSSSEFPEATIEQLPKGAIVIVAIGPRRYRGNADFDPLELPLQLSDGHLLTEGYEGQPAPHVSFFYIDRLVGDDVLNVWGYIGESPPSRAVAGEADKMLASLRVPGAQNEAVTTQEG